MAKDAWIDSNYEVPSSGSRYMKLEDGDNSLRILDKPVMGYELWIDGKPVRKPMGQEFTAKELASADINKFSGEKRKPQHFWAVPVWSYADKNVQVLHISQSSIQTAMLNLARNPKWGALTDYDVVVTKGKDGKQVTYSVTPDPKTPLTKEIKKAWGEVTVNWDAYFEGGHPLDVGASVPDSDEVDDIINE